MGGIVQQLSDIVYFVYNGFRQRKRPLEDKKLESSDVDARKTLNSKPTEYLALPPAAKRARFSCAAGSQPRQFSITDNRSTTKSAVYTTPAAKLAEIYVKKGQKQRGFDWFYSCHDAGSASVPEFAGNGTSSCTRSFVTSNQNFKALKNAQWRAGQMQPEVVDLTQDVNDDTKEDVPGLKDAVVYGRPKLSPGRRFARSSHSVDNRQNMGCVSVFERLYPEEAKMNRDRVLRNTTSPMTQSASPQHYVHSCINLEERERYKLLLDTVNNVTMQSRKSSVIDATSSDMYEIVDNSVSANTGPFTSPIARVREDVQRLKAILNDVQPDNASLFANESLFSPEFSSPVSSSFVATSTPLARPPVSAARNTSISSTTAVARGASSQNDFDLRFRFDHDPRKSIDAVRSSYKVQADRRRQDAEKLRLECTMRNEARRHQQLKQEDEIRLRMRLEGLGIIEDTEEAEEAILPQLTAEHLALVQSAFRGNDEEKLIEAFKIPILRKDIKTLDKLNWLNDEVINFYLQLICARSETVNQPRVYAFNTFFLPKLLQSGHSTLKRWTRSVDIFSFDILLVPVHLGVHWCMATIDLQRKRIDYYDSMGGRNEEVLRALRVYLCDESLDKKKVEFDLSGWTFTFPEDIPRQMNGSDCGVFSCQFAEFASRRAKITFSQGDMPYFRKRMACEILSKKLMI